jgi:hypothetical protein
MSTPKKSLPKIKKQLRGFLTEESSKMTKMDVLKLAVGAVALIGGVNEASAHTNHSSSNPATHASG